MYAIKYYKINDIPVMELIPQTLDNQPAPLAIFYHGWENTKDGTIAHGLQIAKRGFRTIIPDALYHGERRIPHKVIGQDQIVQVIQRNIKEYDQLIEYYQSRNLIKDDYITVSGLSMGGMTTWLLLAKYPSIKASTILMGSPYVVDFLSKRRKIYDCALSISEFNQCLDFISEFDIYKQAEKIDGRPISIWHGTADSMVPFDQAKEFYQSIKEASYAKYVYFTPGEGADHRVPNMEMVRMGEFLQASYLEDKDDIWKVTEDRMSELYD